MAGKDFEVMSPQYSRFQTELKVRPDDIDLYGHVHSSRYMDYVFTARVEQMEHCYKMSMAEFKARGLGWYQTKIVLNYKRALYLGDKFIVETGISTMTTSSVEVSFKIIRSDNHKISAEGSATYALVDLQKGQSIPIPQDIVQKYSI